MANVVLCVLLFTLAVDALNVTAPTADEVVDISKPYNIKWTSKSGDPEQVSIDVVNVTANEQYVLVNNVRGANVSDENYTLRWATAIPSDTAQYTLVFLDYATGGYAGQSAIFNLTLPPGETRNTSVGNAPASPGTASTTQSDTGGLSTGELAAAIVVPIITVIAILVAIFFLWRRRRSQKIKLEEVATTVDETRKAEMDGKGVPGDSTKHESAELGVKDHMNWELPSTPPRKAVDPQELPAEVPVAELNAFEDEMKDTKHTSGISETATTAVGSASGDRIESAISPIVSQDGFQRNSFQQSVRGSPQSATNPHVPRSVAPTTTGRSRFGEALYDLVSDELRRPDG